MYSYIWPIKLSSIENTINHIYLIQWLHFIFCHIINLLLSYNLYFLWIHFLKLTTVIENSLSVAITHICIFFLQMYFLEINTIEPLFETFLIGICKQNVITFKKCLFLERHAFWSWVFLKIYNDINIYSD